MEIFAYNLQLLEFVCCSTLVRSVLFVSLFFWRTHTNKHTEIPTKIPKRAKKTIHLCICVEIEKKYRNRKKDPVKEACVRGTNIVY